MGALEINVLRTEMFVAVGLKKCVAFAVLQGWSEFDGGKSHKENVQSQL